MKDKLLNMPRLIFDIETIGLEFDSLDKKSQEMLLEYAEDEDERQRIRNGLGLSPLTGSIVAIGVLNPETGKGAVYYQKQAGEQEEVDGDMNLVPCDGEIGVIKRFWEVAEHYDQFVTFNGHAFDVPFLTVRSAVLKLKPSKNLISNRYYDRPHLDLMDRLTNFGATRWRKNLHMWCTAFGIKSPKDGGDGNDVARLFKESKCRDIARYCFGDLVATKELLEYWEKYMNK